MRTKGWISSLDIHLGNQPYVGKAKKRVNHFIPGLRGKRACLLCIGPNWQPVTSLDILCAQKVSETLSLFVRISLFHELRQ